MKNEPFVIERTYEASASVIWKALTDEHEMKKWYFDLPGFRAEPGYEFTFTAGPKDGPKYTHLCKITEVIPGKKIAYTWRYEGYTGDSLVTFELFSEGNKTRVKLTHAGLETFPADKDPGLAKKNFEQGWTSFLDVQLKKYLEKVLA